MAHLAAPGLRVLLIGTGEHDDSELPDLPAVPATLDELADVFLRRCGAQSEQVRVLRDPAGIERFGDAVHQAASAAGDVLVVHYVGHGLLDRAGRLYLATRATRHPREGLEHRAFAYAELHNLLTRSPAHTIVVVLDCCFSGGAGGISARSGLPDLDAPHPDGGYLLASAAPEERALAPPGDRHTAFSGTFIRLLRGGHPAGPAEWTLDGLFEHLEREMARRAWPPPHRAVTGHAGALKLAPNIGFRATNPYRGLTAYEMTDARFFFGRRSLTRRLRTRLAGQLSGGGMLVVVGPSGSGKTSLLNAGLCPALRERGLPGVAGSSRWPVLTLTPGAQPLKTLAAKLAAFAGLDTALTREHLIEDPAPLNSAIRAALARDRGTDPGDRRVIVIVDQFEEVLTACGDDRERGAFLRALRSAAGRDALVVLGLRSDFYPRCASEPWGAEPFENQLIVPAMSESELREVIEHPAKEVGLRLEPGLTDRLLRDLEVSENSGRPGAHGLLPLLSYTLSELWERGREEQLSIATYDELGGISRAISRGAGACYDSLREADKETAGLILPRLVYLGERRVEDTRHRIRRGELPSGESTERVLKAFTEERLIIRDHDPVADEETVELAHLALAHKWDRLHDWIEGDRKDNQTHQWLEHTAARWADNRRRPEELPRGDRLVAARELAAKRPTGISDTAREFVDTAVTEERRAVDRRRRAITAATVLVLLVMAVLLAANQSIQRGRDNAVFERVTAQSDRLINSDASLAARLALSAYRMRPSENLGATLITKANSSPLSERLADRLDPFDTVVFGPDGRTIATATTDHHIQLWRISDHGRIERLGRSPTGHGSFVNSLTFRPDSRVLASTSVDETIQLWDIADPSRPRPLGQLRNVADPARPVPPNQPLPAGRIGVLAFSPDGLTLAGASRTDHSVRLWNAADPANPVPAGPPLTGHQSYINSLVFSPDGHTLATASADETVGLWDISGPADTRPPGRFLQGHRSFVNALTFSPDGHTLATTSGDQTVRFWDVTDPAKPSRELAANAGDVTSLAFSPDGQTLATSNGDRTIRLWNLANPTRPVPLGEPLTGLTSVIRTIDFIPGSRLLAGIDGDRTIRLWHLPATVLTGHTDAVYALAFSPDGRTLASGGADRAVRMWDLSDRDGPKPLGPRGASLDHEIGAIAFRPDGHTVTTNGPEPAMWAWGFSDPAIATRLGQTGKLGSLAFSPDANVLAVAGTDQSLSLWNAADPTPRTLLSQPMPGIRVSYVNAAGFSHNGRTLATAHADRHVRLWDVTNPSRPVQLGQPFADQTVGNINTVAFSPHDDLLALASSDQMILLWDIRDRTAPKLVGTPLIGHTGRIHALAFSPDGRTLASAGADRTIRRWDITDPGAPKLLGQPLTGHTGPVHALAFSPDGRILASTGADQTIRIWRLDVEQTIRDICDTTTNALTEDDWRAYVSSDLPYRPSCPP